MKLLPCTLGPSLTVEEALTLSSNFSFAAMFPEKTSEIALGYSGPISSYHTDFLFANDIFPRFLMRAEAQMDSRGQSDTRWRHHRSACGFASHWLRSLRRVCCAHFLAH